jgi:sugar phosphate isomerase/epimerase
MADVNTAPSGRRLPLGAASYTFLFSGDLPRALDLVADTGSRLVEITAAPPQVDDCRLDPAAVRALKAVISRRGLVPTSLNPTFLDLNLASLNRGMRAETVRQLRNGLEACHDLQVPLLVVFPGRRHVLAPAPLQASYDVLIDELGPLAARAGELGVTLGIENGPTNFLDRAEQVAQVCRDLASPRVRAVFDVANAHMVEDPVDGLAAIAPHLALVHLSDTTRARWQHAPAGQGDVDFAAFTAALDASGYTGPSIMEIVDLEQPAAALTGSGQALAPLGWQVGGIPDEPR